MISLMRPRFRLRLADLRAAEAFRDAGDERMMPRAGDNTFIIIIYAWASPPLEPASPPLALGNAAAANATSLTYTGRRQAGFADYTALNLMLSRRRLCSIIIIKAGLPPQYCHFEVYIYHSCHFARQRPLHAYGRNAVPRHKLMASHIFEHFYVIFIFDIYCRRH